MKSFVKRIATAMACGAIVFLGAACGGSGSLVEKGDYKGAYANAKAEGQRDIWRENLIAYLSNTAMDKMEDPSSFELQGAYIDDNNKNVVLVVNEKASSGASRVAYNYFTHMDFSLAGFLSSKSDYYALFSVQYDLNVDEINETDSDEVQNQKSIKNVSVENIISAMGEASNKLGEGNVKNINALFKKGLLKGVELIDTGE